VRARVVAARERQLARFAGTSLRTNAELTPSLLARRCPLAGDARRILATAASRLMLSARGYDRVRKVGRTIADLDGADRIGGEHIAEALQFRLPS
jgi:magnesium chelatase family protein